MDHRTPFAVTWIEASEDERTVAMTAPEHDSHAGYDSEHLDAHALFADLHLEVAPPPMDGAHVSSVPPPPALSLPPAQLYARPDAARAASTVRSRRPRAMNAADPQRARLLAVIACGSLALVAALAACFVYVAAPQPARTASAVTARN